jgi:isopenicillin N synthase-like dioxygenase
LICILTGDQLSQLTGTKTPACIHRVRNRLKRARLSISYELRV